MILAKSLGMIPSWQYDTGWAQNPKYNQFVQFPQGMNQMTVQPIGPNYGPSPEHGLGRSNMMQPACCEDCKCAENCPGCPTYTSIGSRVRRVLGMRRTSGMQGLALGVYSKWALVGGVALVSAALIGGVALAMRK